MIKDEDTLHFLDLAARYWDGLAENAEKWAEYAREQGIDSSAPGESAKDEQARVYRRCAKSIRQEIETGIPHCSCHNIPVEECEKLKEQKNGKSRN